MGTGMQTDAVYCTQMVRKPNKAKRLGEGLVLPKVYLREWMEFRGFKGESDTEGDELLAAELGIDRATVNRWHTHPERLGLMTQNLLAHTFNCRAQDLFRHPLTVSVDDRLAKLSERDRERVLKSLEPWLEPET